MGNNKIIVISGITSFLGSNLARYLVNNGYDICGIVRPNSCNIKNIEDIINKIHLLKIDLADKCFDDFDIKMIVQDDDFLEKLNNSDNIFVHMAWDSSSKLGRNDNELQKQNYKSSVNAYKLSKMLNAEKFIFTSSQAEENNTPYGIYKKAFADDYKNKKDFIHLRIFSIYGQNDYHNSLINYLVECINNKNEAIVGKCEHMWNFLCIEDFVRMIECFITKDVDSNLVYDIASDDNRILKEYLSFFEKKYGLKIKYGVRKSEDEKFSIPDLTNTYKVIGKNFVFTDFMEKYNIL